VLVVSVWRRVLAVDRTRWIWVWSVVMGCRTRWVLLVPRRVHGRIVGRSCGLESRPCPVPRVWSATVLLCPLIHLPGELLRMHPVATSWLNPSHGHIPTLPLAKFSLAELHLALLTLPLLSLPVRHGPLLFVFHHPDGTLRVVLLRRPQLLPVGVHLGRPSGFDWARRTNIRVLPWRAHLPRRHRAARQPPRLPCLLFRRGYGRASLRIGLRRAIALYLGCRMICGRRGCGGSSRIAVLKQAIMFGGLGSSEASVLGCGRRLRSRGCVQ
jgi:hypothetical protein